MKETQTHGTKPIQHDGPPIGERVIRAAWASLRIGFYLILGWAAVLVFSRSARSEPEVFAVIALSITMVSVLTYFVFGAAGYKIKGDTLRAPRALVWGFLFLIAATVLFVLLWLEAHNQLGGPR